MKKITFDPGWVVVVAVALLSANVWAAETAPYTAHYKDQYQEPSSSQTQVTDRTTSYTDQGGEKWQRWVLTEQDGEKTLILVVENPVRHQADASVSQRVIYRKSLLSSNESLIQKKIDYFSTLKDLHHRGRHSIAPWVEDPASHQPLWVPIRDQWTADDEKDYSKWYTANVTTNLLVGSGILVDCAKFATAVRWIYAHDHLLPAVNSLAASGKYIGHFSGTAAWDALPTDPDWHKDRRFKTALQYVLDNIYTHSIFKDLYPTELSQTYVNPGSILLILYSHSTGHTEVVNTVGPNSELCPGGDCISVLYGNEPAAERAYFDNAWIVNGGQAEGGFLRWRWPLHQADGSWNLVSAQTMPGYSLAQYSQPTLGDDDFAMYVYTQLGMLSSDTSNAILTGNALIQQLRDRFNLTAMGYMMCSVQRCDPASSLYSDYSTPSHDLRIRQNQEKFAKYYRAANRNDPYLINMVATAHDDLYSSSNLNYWQYLMDENNVLEKMSPDPTASFASRWGAIGLDNSEMLQLDSVAWQNVIDQREELVIQAYDLCYSSDGNHLVCDPNASNVRALATTRLDQSILKERLNLEQLMVQLSAKEQSDAVTFSQQTDTPVRECEWNSTEDNCTLYDYLFSNHHEIEKISSDPTAQYNIRWGN